MDRVCSYSEDFSDSPLTVAVSHRAGDAVRIALTGDLDRATAPQLVDAVHQVIASGRPETLVLDLGELRFLDVGGARAVSAAQASCAAAGWELTVENPTPFVRRVLEITGSACSPRRPSQPAASSPVSASRRATS